MPKVLSIPLLIVILFHVSACTPPLPELADIDGNTYLTHVYGETRWMIENLRVGHTPDGRAIKRYAPDSVEANIGIYGGLYDYETACKICPTGWRLPNNDDWEVLVNRRNKEASAFMDQAYFSAATNETGFSVRPAGYGNNGAFDNHFGESATIWSHTTSGEFAWSYRFEKGKPKIRSAEQHPIYAFSVRCVQDL